MVTAGLYMLTRTNVIFQHSQTMMLVVALVGAFTAIFAATIGITQNDIKKVLAYSTVSQLGFMFPGVRRRRVHHRHLSRDDARVFQSADVPWFRVSHSRHAPRAGHAQDGRPEEIHAHHLHDLPRRVAGHLRHHSV
jgi:hypothetical protein